ncbi:MAG TPA: PD-(D/E)XK nuclease family protein [Salinivirgaceae bacterium]|nr:PD-(D/E)XK nuclease family protein [Salinivirgaceae bacterium]
MEKFLQLVCKELAIRYKNDELSDFTVVLPGRRPEYYFYRALSEHLEKPHLAPKIVTLSELAQSFSIWDMANDMELIFRLFVAYRKILNVDQDFNTFYFWGEMLLRDFNDVDMALADPELVFRYMYEAKSIDEKFKNPEIDEIVSRFHGALTKMKNRENELSQKVIRFWQNLFSIYTEFNTGLENENLGYKGKIFRDVCSRQDKVQELLAGKKYAVVGFEMFQTAEKKFLQMLRDSADTIFFWDYDSMYLNPDFVTAKELKHLLTEFSPAIDLSQKNYFTHSSKEVNLCYSPGNMAALTLAAKIAEDYQNQNPSPEITAVIIPDTTLIFPLLKCFSQQNQINITAGYPVYQSRVAAFLLMIIELRTTAKSDNNELKTDILLKILSSNWFDQNIVSPLINEFRSSFFIPAADILEKFKSLQTPDEESLKKSYDLLTLVLGSDQSMVFDQLVKVLELLQQILEADESAASEQQTMFEQMVCEELKTKYRQISNVASRFSSLMDWHTQLRFARQVVQITKMPMEGSPLSGIQVLSFSETTVIDFEHVIIPCANEGILPKIDAINSHIPFAIRKAFGLSTLFDDEIRQAYWFYRLIQRAKKITFIVNTSENQIGTPDSSRYIKQLEYYCNQNWNWKKSESKFSINVNLPKNLSFAWDRKVHDYMNQFFLQDLHQKKLSPSAINTYLQCSLRFYFKYPCGLTEPEVASGIIESNDFGTLLHRTFQAIYKNFVGGIVTREVIENILPTIRNIVDNEYQKLVINRDSGYNHILKDLVVTYVEKILEIDSEKPFKVIALEKDIYSPFSFELADKTYTIKIGGIVDRIDKVGNNIRILDYKTGKIIDSKPDLKKVFAFNDPKQQKELLQTFLYRQVYLKNHSLKENETITVGLIIPHENKDSCYYFFTEFNFEQNAEKFEDNLKQVLSDMFNPKNTFEASSYPDVCKYCPYIEICGR